MTEDQAQDWLQAHGWWAGDAGERLRRFVALVLEEADRQNLISANSRAQIWARHIVDSAQLMTLAQESDGEGERWVDLGTGAGFPGLVVACLRTGPMSLVEMRPLRVAFLERVVRELALDHVEVLASKVERTAFAAPAGIISARAYAPLDRLLQTAHHLADRKTLWLLPKGRNGEKELAIARQRWQAVFHVEQSLTDAESAIVIARDVTPRIAPKRASKPMNPRKNRRAT
ncbi:MAG TPA: 16S rRNA (guanine(527)-N(7))-methyltransferase RsmG [Sphingobium sp.]|nr:16S rRNA (guanine(527)-N(7))-methyltransferase RsmG [Sphingobium sp.]